MNHQFLGRPALYDPPYFYEMTSDFGKKTAENYWGTLKKWTKQEIDETVLDSLYDVARVPAEKVLVFYSRSCVHVLMCDAR